MPDKYLNKYGVKPIFPKPLKTGKAYYANKLSDLKQAAYLIKDQNYVVVEDEYHTGLDILFQLKKICSVNLKNKGFKKDREFRHAYNEASNRLLIPVSKGKINLSKAPKIGWLKEFYPENDEVYLSMPQIQGLNSSWQWYKNGLSIPTLNDLIKPFYGTYFPTRFDHILLFDKWLRNYNSSNRNAVDMGCGCGIISLQLIKYGFNKIYAYDINPNAIISTNNAVEKYKNTKDIIVKKSDLFSEHNEKTDLIVFNPPWIPADSNSDFESLDAAIYYNDNLFDKFFEQAKKYLNPESGKIVILFSNFAENNVAGFEHPIKKLLDKDTSFKKSQYIRKKQTQKKSSKTKRQNRRVNEYVELWELILN